MNRRGFIKSLLAAGGAAKAAPAFAEDFSDGADDYIAAGVESAGNDYRANCHDPLSQRIARRHQPPVPMPHGTWIKIAVFVFAGVALAAAVTHYLGRFVAWAITRGPNKNKSGS